MSALSAIIDRAVADVIAEHPKLFIAQNKEHTQKLLVREIVKSLVKEPRESADGAEPSESHPPAQGFAAALVSIDDERAIAYTELRRIAGAVAPMRSGNQIYLPREGQTTAVKIFASLPDRSQWPLVTERRQLAAWFEFFEETLPGVSRRNILKGRESEGATPGLLLPWVWPPSKSGKTYDVAPSEEDLT